jgi:heme exporter protein B
MSALVAVLWKDLVSEWRSRDRVVAMLLFSLLVVVVFHFALPSGMGERTRELAPGLLWVAYVFAAVLGLNRAFSVELENDALTGLALVPRDRGFVFLGKAAASFVILALVQAITAFVFAVVFELSELREPATLARLAGVVALGSLGICTVGTLFAAIAVRTRFREVMLPLLLLPLLIPVLSGSVRATADLLLHGRLEAEPIELLLVADAVYLIASFVGFEYVLDE